MQIVTGLLTFVLVLVSLFLILLVLVQLPKKEAGVGMAFGAGMSEMILGAGSGNVLTRITKYTVGIFLGLSLVLSIMISSQARQEGLGVTRALEEQARSTPAPAVATPPATPGLQALPTVSNLVNPPAGASAPVPGVLSTTVVVNPAAPAGATSEPVAAPPIPLLLTPTPDATNRPALE